MAITPTSSEERAVYDALKEIFTGDVANIRRLGKTQEIVKQHSKEERLSAVLRSHSVADVSISAQQLLIEGIFDSKKKAKTRFALLPTLCPEPRVELAPAKIENAKNQATSSTVKKPQNPATDKATVPDLKTRPTGSTQAQTGLIKLAKDEDKRKEPRTSASIKDSVVEPSLLSADKPKLSTSMSSLPYGTQYYLLVDTQRFLEDACFQFAQRQMPSTLSDNGWDCAEALELNLFVKELSCQGLASKLMPATKPSTEKLLVSVADIRHAAVHRSRLSAHDVDRTLQNSEQFLALIGDTERLERIKDLRRDAFASLAQLDLEEREACSALDLRKKEIERRRIELKRLEEAAVMDMEQTRGRFRGVAATNIMRAISSTRTLKNGMKSYEDPVRRNVMMKLVLTVLSAAWDVSWAGLKLVVAACVASFIFVSRHVV